MSAVSGAVETAPVTSVHAHRSADPDDFAVPTGREEEWRFTPLRRLRGLHAETPLAAGGVRVSVDAAPEIDFSERTVAPAEGTFLPDDRISARAFSAAGTATVITVPKEAVASRPTFVSVTGEHAAGAADSTSATSAAAGHLVIEVRPYGRATVVIDQRGSATYADNVEINIADGGDLTLVWIAEWGDDTVHVSHHEATIGRDAHLKHIAVTVGGALVRLSPTIRYAGPGGDAELYGITFATASSSTGGQHLEHRLFVDHDTPNCRSRVTYKGALAGDDAHTVWIGDVLIRPEATGTDTYEYNRNLVLTDGARADSVPNLEILTGEIVGAGHASANGRLDDEHLFYLMARGIPLAEARRLVIRGFFGELIAKIGVPEVEERVAARIEAELAGGSLS
jgi:Fe-S cluster assembly protein SufD